MERVAALPCCTNSPCLTCNRGKMYKKSVSRKIILFLLLGAMGIMLFALLYGVFDIRVLHDTQPFFVDPESAVVVASALLFLNLRVMAIGLLLLNITLLVQLLILPISAPTECWPTRGSAPEPSVSPPFNCLSPLRI